MGIENIIYKQYSTTKKKEMASFAVKWIEVEDNRLVK